MENSQTRIRASAMLATVVKIGVGGIESFDSLGGMYVWLWSTLSIHQPGYIHKRGRKRSGGAPTYGD